MNATELSEMSVEQLVEQFAEIGIAQYQCIRLDDNAGFSRLYSQEVAATNELKGRDGDARTALLQLYQHPSMHVRVMAAKATLALAPQRARSALEAISVSKCYPEALDAHMSLYFLDRGIFKPE